VLDFPDVPFTPAEFAGLGLTHAAVRAALRRGEIRRLLRGV
jgi:hypothetical protein